MSTRANILAGTAGALLILLLLIAGLALIAGRIPGKLSQARKRGWLMAHIILVIIYFSGVLGSLLLAVLTTLTGDGELIYAAHFFIQYFDWFLIIPGALGSVITGTWLAARTHWGLTRHYWVMPKWVGNIAAILFGSSVVRIGIDASLRNTFHGRINPWPSPAYLQSRQLLFIGLAVSLVILITLLFISYFKPWGKRQAA